MYLDKAIRELTGENVHVTGASRTDAGVHAYGNVAVFDTESTIPGDRFTFALNRFLPDSIVIQDSWEVSSDFHPRHCNTRKTYEYRILNTAVPLPQKLLKSCSPTIYAAASFIFSISILPATCHVKLRF